MTSQLHFSDFPGRIIIVGFGAIGQGVLPLILRHIGCPPERITIVTAEEQGQRSRPPATASSSSRSAWCAKTCAARSIRWSGAAISS